MPPRILEFPFILTCVFEVLLFGGCGILWIKHVERDNKCFCGLGESWEIARGRVWYAVWMATMGLSLVGYRCGNRPLERTEVVSAGLGLCLTTWLGRMQEREGMWMPEERLRFFNCLLKAVLQCLVTLYCVCLGAFILKFLIQNLLKLLEVRMVTCTLNTAWRNLLSCLKEASSLHKISYAYIMIKESFPDMSALVQGSSSGLSLNNLSCPDLFPMGVISGHWASGLWSATTEPGRC